MCLFCKIASKQIPSKTAYEDDDVYAFHDITPIAPTHILVIPRTHIESAADLGSTPDDAALVGRLFATVADLADREGLRRGWRVVTNVGPDGGQSVQHLHLHLLGGRRLTWPPG